ncbi:MAG: F0F1 ATP synthase subunit B [Candidatus Peribacteraceae bacterium]|nr:F0F1 ATP synthase subunit B [Candidatus Peribacteraceae bacterium]
MELLTKLGIQWGLLIAQIVNFLIVAGVLGFFIYKPILKLLDDRTERIRAAAEKAKKLEEQAKEMEAIRVEKLKKIDAECGKLLETAKKQAEQVQADILERASKEAALLIERGKQSVAEERDRALSELQGRIAGVIVGLSEKILAREFSSADQTRILESLKKDIPALLK